MSEVVLKRRAPLDVVRYVLQKLEKQAVAAGSFPVLIHEGLEAEEKVRVEVDMLREENVRLTSRNDEQYQTIKGLQDDLRRLEGIITAARIALVPEVK